MKETFDSNQLSIFELHTAKELIKAYLDGIHYKVIEMLRMMKTPEDCRSTIRVLSRYRDMMSGDRTEESVKIRFAVNKILRIVGCAKPAKNMNCDMMVFPDNEVLDIIYEGELHYENVLRKHSGLYEAIYPIDDYGLMSNQPKWFPFLYRLHMMDLLSKEDVKEAERQLHAMFRYGHEQISCICDLEAPTEILNLLCLLLQLPEDIPLLPPFSREALDHLEFMYETSIPAFHKEYDIGQTATMRVIEYYLCYGMHERAEKFFLKHYSQLSDASSDTVLDGIRALSGTGISDQYVLFFLGILDGEQIRNRLALTQWEEQFLENCALLFQWAAMEDILPEYYGEESPELQPERINEITALLKSSGYGDAVRNAESTADLHLSMMYALDRQARLLKESEQISMLTELYRTRYINDILNKQSVFLDELKQKYGLTYDRAACEQLLMEQLQRLDRSIILEHVRDNRRNPVLANQFRSSRFPSDAFRQQVLCDPLYEKAADLMCTAVWLYQKSEQLEEGLSMEVTYLIAPAVKAVEIYLRDYIGSHYRTAGAASIQLGRDSSLPLDGEDWKTKATLGNFCHHIRDNGYPKQSAERWNIFNYLKYWVDHTRNGYFHKSELYSIEDARRIIEKSLAVVKYLFMDLK
ncbi:MAG: hypothetical protein IJ265_04320 [Oscillospiraceae bacterium]|nr:hypothetical protein [Oscillospiraceae bacterium]